MSKRTIAGSGLALLLAAVGVAAVLRDAPEPKAPEELLPAGAVFYASWDGGSAHEEAWKETAAYESYHGSGLDELVERVVTSVTQQAKASGVPVDFDGAFAAIGHLAEHGTSIAVTLDEAAGPIPTATLVLHDAGEFEPAIGDVLKKIAEGEGIAFEQRTIGGRKVVVTRPPNVPVPIDVGWWVETGHIVVVVGPNAAERGIAVANGEAPNITTDPLWKKYGGGGDADFAVTGRMWVDVAKLRKTFGGMPTPPLPDGRVLTVEQAIEPTGLNGLDAIAFRSGYDGRAMRSDVMVDAPGPRKGLLALLDQKPISLDELPPLPRGVMGFTAISLDWAATYDTWLGIADAYTKLGPPEAREEFQKVVDGLPDMVGFDPRNDLLEPLGNVACAYSEPDLEFFGLPLGFGVAISVDDADKLGTTLSKLTARAERMAPPDQFSVQRSQRMGRDMVTLEIGGGFVNPTYVVDDDWLVIGLTPQTVQSFALRVDEKLGRWSPEDHANVLAEVPEEFTSISFTDPRPAVRSLAAAAPTLVGFAQGGIRQTGQFGPNFRMPITAADIPPAELITRPLFPNVTVGTVDDDGMTTVARASLPAMPSIGSGGAAVPVLVGLLLPAVQSAREAARRSASKNNLKQIGLALHNYHDTYRNLPPGTVANAQLKPDARLSWMYEILPYVEGTATYRQIDRTKGWEDDANVGATSVTFDVFRNPGAIDPTEGGGTTHYVGIAGYGKDPWLLPAGHARAGVFGYDRRISFRDVTDGTSNTLAVSEASGDYGSWAAGGSATIRGFTTKPYINGPDGIGGPYEGGCNMLMLDGSVRFVSEDVDPKLLESLSTIGGGEVIPNF